MDPMKPKSPVNLKPGDLVYFKKVSRSTKKGQPEIAFKGNGFGILLGLLPPAGQEPPAEHLFRLMGTIGFLTFDNVMEFLGEDQAEICIKKFEDKFYGEKVEVPPQPSQILDANGQATTLPPRLEVMKDTDGQP